MLEAITAITVKTISGLLIKAGEGAVKSGVAVYKKRSNATQLYRAVCSRETNNNYTLNVINKVFTFRTIINGDKDVYLDQIYHPLKISDSEGRLYTVNDQYILPSHSPVCLVGLAGQGKTITMKKLFLEELNNNEWLPIFISLRSVGFSEKISLPEVIKQHFELHGVPCDFDNVNHLLNTVNIRIFFRRF